MILLRRFFLSLSGFLALCSCSAVDILNFTIPRSGYTVSSNITYGDNPRQQLDIYIPHNPVPGNPVILFFYGGSWQTGNKKDYLFAGQAFASKGFTTVIADYRLYPEVYFPDFLTDGATAFTWVHKHIKDYGGNPDNIYLAGHSAGGYIAVMLTLNEHYITQAGGQTSWIKGTIGIAGPYDFLPFTDPKIKAIFSKSADAATQPINYVRTGLPPLLLVTGDKDTDVLPRNTINLTAKLRQSGNQVTEKIYPGVGHIGIVLSLASGFRSKAPTLQDITAFIKQ